MRWPKWQIAAGRGDFLPIVIGCVMFFISLPSVVLLLLHPDRNSGVIGVPLMVILSIGTLIGLAFIILGIQLCSTPGSLTYRLAHGRFFSH